MKLKDIVTLKTKSIVPLQDEHYHLYSLPSFDKNQCREEILGKDIQSNKYIVPDKCILFNKLNVRFKRVWRIDNKDNNKLCSTEFLPLIIDKTKVNYQYCYYLLISERITDYLCGQNTNTSGSHKRIDPLDFLNIDIQLPFIEEQTRIGSLLAYIDSKIALNRAINHWFEVPEQLIETFHTIVSQYHLMIDQNIIENNNLIKQRDELLPLLMNGQVSVNYDLSHD